MRDQQIFDIVRAALRYPPEERAAFLDAACDDPILRREVDALLAADEEAGGEDFLDTPVLDVHALAPPLGAPEDADTDPMVAQQVGAYVIERRLGAGGMGVVYAARDPRLERTVALKFLPAALSADAAAMARFVREARAASALDHPNICTIYEIGETTDGRLFLAMAYYEGQTLAQRIAEGALPVDAVVDVLRQAAAGLRRAHAAGIVHRDVKPSNLMLTSGGVVKILDFGIAKLDGRHDLTREGSLLGTVAYMAPEQARSERVDARADVWALGVVTYEMLTGERPFDGQTTTDVLNAVQHADPAPIWSLRPGVPAALERIVLRMLEKEPTDRYASFDAVLADLDAAELPARREASPRRSRSRLVRWIAGSVGALVLLLLVLFATSDAGTGTTDHAVHSIAVLPLANHTGDPAHAPFAEGMTDALIADLGQIENLRVLSRTSALRFRETDKSLPEIARELGVTTVVEGAVRADDGRVGISVQLVDASSDRILWSQSYERELRDIVSLQHEVALAIAREVEASLTPQVEAHLTSAPAVDPEAYTQYLWGLYYRNRETLDAWEESVASLEQAIALDSTFAPAYAVLSRVLVHTPGVEPPERARRLAERALALDPTLPDAYVSLGLYHEMVAWDWPAAERAFRQALRLNPGDAEAFHELGLLLMRQRRFDEALPAVQRSLYLDPLSARYLNGVAAVHLFRGDYARALELLQQSLALDATNAMTYWRAGQAHQGLGQHEAAITAFRRMIELGGTQPTGHLGHALAVVGRRAEAQAVLDELLARFHDAGATDTPWISYNIALVHVGLGQYDTALDWLERSLAERSNLMVYLGIVPAWAPLHDHPRFQALLREIGLRVPVTQA